MVGFGVGADSGFGSMDTGATGGGAGFFRDAGVALINELVDG